MYVEDYDIKAILLTSIDNVQLCPYIVIKYVIFFACLIFFIYKSLFNILIFSYGPRSPPLFNLKCKVLDWMEEKMKYEVDSYILEYIEDNNAYYIYFKDSVERNCQIKINKEIFDAYMDSKKAYVKIKNETSRHLEQSTLTEEELYHRAFKPTESVEEMVIKNINKERMRQALNNLTETQHRRMDLHIINEITIRDIAKLEKVQKSQIQKSLQQGVKKIRVFFEE